MEAIDYAVPNTVEEAIEILSSKGEKARVLAGGTDLLVQLRGGRYSLDTVSYTHLTLPTICSV